MSFHRYRLLKPKWGKDKIKGKTVLEGFFDSESLKQINNAGYNIYFFPNHSSKSLKNGTFMSGRDVDVFNYIFIDMDLKDGIYESKEDFLSFLSDFPVSPTMTVDSGNGIHVYWEIEDLHRESFIALQFMLIQHFQTDSSVWTPLQLMRAPGYNNTKDPDNYKYAEILSKYSTERTYESATLLSSLPGITEDNAKKLTRHINKLDGIETVEVDDFIETDELPEAFQDLLEDDELVHNLFLEPRATQGDRSSADFRLGHILFDKDFDRGTTFQIMYNTQKALSKDSYRFEYACNIVEKIYDSKTTNRVPSVADMKRHGRKPQLGEPVKGPTFFDCNIKPWRKKHVMGLIAGPGTGKTTVSLKVVKEMMQRNLDRDDIYIFFSLEMTLDEILEKWDDLVGEDSPMHERLFIVSNEDEDGDPRRIGFQEIQWFSEDIKKYTGKEIGAVVIDHMNILNNTIDISKKPTFGAEGDEGNGNIRKLTIQSKCAKMKELAKSLDCFLIVQSQTTKDKAADCDVPLAINAAYGAADFEWFSDYIITCWQPLKSVETETELRVLGWQLCKNRHRHKDDLVQLYDRRLLRYDSFTGDLDVLIQSEMDEFNTWEREIRARKRSEEKSKVKEIKYKNSPKPDIKTLDKLLGDK